MNLTSGFYPQQQSGFSAWAGAWQSQGMGMGMGATQGMWGAAGVGRMDMVAFSFMMQPMSCHCCHGASRISEDPYGVAQSGQGMRSNLANSPEVMLALNDLLKDGSLKSYDDVAKALKDKYGIQAEVGDIKSVGKDGKETTAKGLKFANGDYFVDGNGDNALSKADYKFDDAVKALKEKYGLGDEDVKSITENMKARASFNQGGEGQHGGIPMLPGMGAQFGMGMGMFGPWANMNWMFMFSRAFQMAA